MCIVKPIIKKMNSV